MRCKNTHLAGTTVVEEDLAEAYGRRLQGKVDEIQRSCVRIRGAGETSTRCCVRFSHY